ncbi:MAG: aromatic ring-hydroxylating dioxygenase subunit alpha [Actinomycetota bacterium]|nr:aromatic ring-hydroxylating dioxygenase subunit alpha [Actinomycetota bacterium]|tara:strand:+ start:10811 stop:12190 length:1380 start_codon:yes stop_codon:yes gene_type:complete
MVKSKKISDSGEARAPGPSLREHLLADGSGVSPPLLEESYVFLGSEDISYDWYTSKERLSDEFLNLWPKVWQWACREEHIPEPGDYYVYDIGELSAIIVRTEDRSIKAYYNACMHRGTQLKPPASCGATKGLKCPFHGWTWSLEGELVDLPQEWDFPHVDSESHRLPEVKVGLWGGFVFLNFDQDAEPLEQYLGVLPEHFSRWKLEDRYIETHVCKRLPANWKASAEAFIEAYHIRETHAGGKPGTEAPTQYDIFGENVTRFVHTIGSRNGSTEIGVDEQERLERLLKGKLDGKPVPKLPEGVKARDFYAQLLQKEYGEKYGKDFSDLTTSETIDSIEYFLFPNAFFFPGLTLPMVYRFRPDPTDPDYCNFDLIFLRPKPEDGIFPNPPEPVNLEVEESYTLVESVGPLGVVYDQDTSNLAAQTRGFKSSLKRGQTLGNYQEVRIRHLQMKVNEYLSNS